MKTDPTILFEVMARGNDRARLAGSIRRSTVKRWAGLVMLTGLLGWINTSLAATTPFSFTLDEPSKTSAGVFAPDGTLIRTLWSKTRYYSAGTYSNVWDGLDDTGTPAPAGVYQIKLLQHNTEYVWDGTLGNTSAELSGPTVHTGFLPMRDMAIAGTNAFYVTGYNEGKYDFCNFLTTDPQHVKIKWGADGQPSNIYDRNWSWTATDGNRVYFACSAATNPNITTNNNYPGFVVASQVGASSPANSAAFSQGGPIINGANTNTVYPNGVYVGTQPGLSGLAVQTGGNLLAVSVAPDNRVYLLDKLSGAAIRNFSVSSPGRLSFSPDGSLWVIAGNNVIGFTNLNAAPTAAVTIPNFSKPLAVAVNPANANIILVADGGGSQQVKAFDGSGNSLWTYGLAGGYQMNGVAVTTNKFWFYDGEEDGTFLCFAPDGSFWVGDGGNHRDLHFSATLAYLEQIMFQPHSYMTYVDQNNPTRVFNQFLEFKVDYSKPLPQGWTLVNNWKANVPAVNISWNEGLREVTTFPNGRTYALVDSNGLYSTTQELCELGTNYLRLTGRLPIANAGWLSFGPAGSLRVTSVGVANWYECTLNGFDTNNNPVWNPPALIASAPNGSTDPVPRCCSFGNVRATVSTNNILISFDQSQNNGWHLGGIRLGSTKWLWKASPTGNYLNGCGNYEIGNGMAYAGNTVQAVERNVIYGFHGEFFRGNGEAAQIMHFYDDGLFVGQFGEALNGHQIFEGALPGFAGNGHCPNLLTTTNGGYFAWVNDESDHGPQRWHFANAKNIRELTGSGSLGSAITLTNPPSNFPCAVTGRNGNQSAELSWLPVAGATAYNLRYSLINGGPYTTLGGSTPNLDLVVGGLTNGLTYYFVVTAVQAGTEGPASEQVKINPFDTTQNVFCTGSMSEGGQFTPIIHIATAAPALGQPSYGGAEHLTGVLNLRELDAYGYGNLQHEVVGTKGYNLFEYQGPATSLANILAPFTYSYGYGWKDIANLQRQFRLDNNALGMNNGMVASPVGALNIGVTDTNFHYLTVVSPAQFNNPRKFTLGIISTNGTSAQFAINEANGLTHVFQFLFRSNITLQADQTGGSGAIVQAIFLDDAAVTYGVPQTQAQTASTTAISASPNPALAGSGVTVSATVSGTGGQPTGLVTFLDGGTSLGTGTLNSSGVAILNTAALSVGGSPHAITAAYSGDSTFGGSTSSVLSQVITNIASSTTVSSSQNPALIASAVTFSATVTANGATPSGTVTFFDGGTSLGTGSLNRSGVAVLSTTSLAANSWPHAITAVYAGNNPVAGSTSGVLSEMITNNATANTDITNGLVVDYPLAASGNDAWGGNNLTLVGAPVFSSGAINWNGAVPTLGYSPPQQWPQSGLTVSAWINLTDPTGNYTVAACYGNYSNTVGAAYLQFYTWAGTLNARIIQNRDVDFIGRSTPATLSTGWHFVAATWAGGASSSSVRIYLDGAPIDNADNQSGTFTGAYAGSDVPLSVGAQLCAGYPVGALFTGSQREVRLYNRALSAGEIGTLYAREGNNTIVIPPPTLPPPFKFRIIGP